MKITPMTTERRDQRIAGRGVDMSLYNEILPEFQKFGAILVGMSVDGLWYHEAFCKRSAIALSAEQRSPQSLRRLENEYSFAAGRDPAWRPSFWPLLVTKGRTILVLKDPGD